MTSHEKRLLLAIDRQIDTNPARLTPEQITLWRQLLIKCISEGTVLLDCAENLQQISPQFADGRMA